MGSISAISKPYYQEADSEGDIATWSVSWANVTCGEKKCVSEVTHVLQNTQQQLTLKSHPDDGVDYKNMELENRY